MIAELAVSFLQAVLVYAAARLALPLLPPVPRISLAYWRVTLALLAILPILACVGAPEGPLPGAGIRFSAMAASRIASAAFPYTHWLEMVLAAGAALGLIRLLSGCLQIRRYRRRAVPLSPPDECTAPLRALTEESPEILFSGDVAVPASYGFRKPVILLPAAWPALPQSVRRAALTHEFLHLQRRDWLAHFAEELLLAAVWFHPVLHAVVRRLRLSREEVVDAASIAVTGSAREYLQSLLAFAGMPAAAVPASGFSAAQQLKDRIETIHKECKMPKNARLKFYSVSMLVAAAAAATVWSLPLRSAAPASETIYRVGGDIKPPRVVSRVDAAYTPEAKRAKVHGVVVLTMIVGRDGVPRNIRVMRGLGSGLDQKAVAAVRQWRFEPATREGKPVSVRATIEINFKLV